MLVYLVYDLEYSILAASKILLLKYVTAKQILKKFRVLGHAERTYSEPFYLKKTKT